MGFAEQQHRAHVERQQRLGRVAAGPVPAPMATPAQAKSLRDLEREVARLSARLRAMLGEDESSMLLPNRIRPVVNMVADHYGMTPEDIASWRRTPDVARARQIAIYLARTVTKYSLSAIGRVLDRDHTTVLYSCRRIESLRRQDSALDREIRELTERATHEFAE